MGRRPAFVLNKIGPVAWAERGERGGGRRGCVRVEVGEGGRGGHSGRQRKAADSGPRPAGASGGAVV
jgi:hypothetical protein